MNDDKILNDDREVLNEEHPEGHDDQYRNQWFGDMFKVPTDDKTRQAPDRLSTMNVTACQEDKQYVTYEKDEHYTKNVMTALQEDRHNQTSQDWNMMQEASQVQEDQDDLTTGGGGHN
jgi:hypothetical protein